MFFRAVEEVEEAELLLSVGRGVGDVPVDDDHLPRDWMGFEEQPVGEPAQVSGADRALEPGQGGLGIKINDTLRSIVAHDLESRPPGPGCSIIVVFIALGNGEQACERQG